MKKSFIGHHIVLLASLASYGVIADVHGAELEGREITTQLLNVPGTADLNGACSKCVVNTVAQAERAAEDGATLELYYDDERVTLHGYLELTILRHDGTYQTQTIEDVDLRSGEATVFDLGPQVGWSWREDVEHLWVEVVAADG